MSAYDSRPRLTRAYTARITVDDVCDAFVGGAGLDPGNEWLYERALRRLLEFPYKSKDPFDRYNELSEAETFLSGLIRGIYDGVRWDA